LGPSADQKNQNKNCQQFFHEVTSLNSQFSVRRGISCPGCKKHY
jgi:hypothetical protein